MRTNSIESNLTNHSVSTLIVGGPGNRIWAINDQGENQ
jgi:hypothetical protein